MSDALPAPGRDQRISIYLSNAEMDALRKMAAQERRSVYQQAAFIIGSALLRAGFLTPPPEVPTEGEA